MEAMVRKNVMCAMFFGGGYDYHYFQNSGASNDDFFLSAFIKTLLRLSRVIKISKNAF